METTLLAADKTYQAVGMNGFLIIVVAIGFGFMVWRIVQAQDKLATHQENISTLFAAHLEQTKQLSTCSESIKNVCLEIKGGLNK